MNQEQWSRVDQYFVDLLVRPDPMFEAALNASDAAGLPQIQVAPNQGKFLMLLAQAQGARSILEIGTLGGYSTIWLARALPPSGRLITLEVSQQYAKVAAANISRANLSSIVDLRVGPALESLPSLVAEGHGPFDLIFIDADKETTPDYFLWALKLSRAGSLIIVDNVIRKGALLDAESTDPAVKGMRRFIHLLGAE